MKRNITVILVSLTIGTIFGRFLIPTNIIQTANAVERSNKIDKDEFSEEKLLTYMKELNIKYIETSFAQSQLESSYYTSNVFKDNSNMFGLKQALERPTTAIGTNRNHAKYKDWRKCVVDFALLQTRILAKTKNKQEYREYIAKFYAEDPHYLEKVDKKVEENRECGKF